jgi:putative pyruvate formate lyase activating enzyme
LLSPEPFYLQFSAQELSKIADEMAEEYSSCQLCPHECKVNRHQGALGFCRAGDQIKLGSASLHWGEEPPITGTRGSGTLFFSHYTLSCIYCQNYPLSQLHHGQLLSEEDLAARMLKLQKEGAHNLNWVTATQFLPSAFRALLIAREQGLRIPVIYNTSGWESDRALGWFSFFVDGYLVDSRYFNDETAKELSGARSYRSRNIAVLQSIRKQLPYELFDSEEILQKGMIVRILILPHYTAETVAVIHQLKQLLGTEVYVSLMSQYFPAYKAFQHPHMRRKLLLTEYQQAVDALEACGFEKGWVQGYDE